MIREERSIVQNSSKIRTVEKLSFTFGVFSQNLVFAYISAYIMIFYTDVAGISSAAAGTLLLVVRMWDAVNDPVMGIITERTNTRFGKFRPFLLIVSVPIVIIMYLLFTPDVIKNKVLWAYIAYILFDIVYTISDIPLWSMTSVMTYDPDERTKLISFGKMIAPISFILVSVITVPLLQAFGNGASAYRNVALMYGLLMAAGMMVTFFNTRERVEHKEEKISIKEILGSLKDNKPIRYILITQIFISTVDSLVTSVVIYYATYNLKDANLAPVLSLAMILPMLLGIFITSKLTVCYDKKKLLITALIIRMIGYGVLFFIGYTNVAILITGLAFVSITFGAPEILLPSMMVETIDYTEWKTGRRTEGIMWSTQTFVVKAGSSLAGVLLGFFLKFIKYVPNVPQTPGTLSGMHSIFTIIPVVFIFLSVIPILFYPLTKEKYQNILRELNKTSTGN